MISKKKLVTSTVFLFFMVFIAFIKNETRSIEKNIYKQINIINKLENNLIEAQLEYSYLSSPETVSKKISIYSDENYSHLGLSRIYQDITHFLAEKTKITKVLEDEISKK